jgi:hypothetical protein
MEDGEYPDGVLLRCIGDEIFADNSKTEWPKGQVGPLMTEIWKPGKCAELLEKF